METIEINQTKKMQSKTALWIGRILSGLSILFLLVDAIMKIARESHHVEGTQKMGFADGLVQPIGIILLVCTLLYIIPRTAIFGAILLTAYFGGATAVMLRAGEPFFFPVIFGILVWGGLYLRDAKLRALVPIKREEV